MGDGAARTWIDYLRDFLRLLRPEFWMVCLLPTYMGFVLAERAFVPHQDALFALATQMFETGLTTAEFLAGIWAWLASSRRLFYALLALGPLIWGSTLLFNDYWDLALDRANPRRQRSPLVLGRIPSRHALVASLLIAAAGLALAALVSGLFLALMSACVALSWAYSAPPLRLKGRPGGDLAVNAIGIGVLCALAGWSLSAPVSEFPWIFLLQSVLLLVSLYIPSTIWDHDYDRAGGVTTFAVALGPRLAYRAGLAALLSSILGAVALAWANYVMERAFLGILVPFCVLVLWQYVHYIGHWEEPRRLLRGIVLVSATLAVVNILFLFVYTGLWRL